jgi:GNAT superfamily N-acetyltransferase
MFVVEKTRGQGLGRAMLEMLIAEARRLGISALRLETGIWSHEALARALPVSAPRAAMLLSCMW